MGWNSCCIYAISKDRTILQTINTMKQPNLLSTWLFFLLVFLSASLFGQNPTISVQGTLKDASGASVADGMREVTFRLYNVESGGTVLWTETATVSVIGGIYSHNLGSVEPLVEGNFAANVYLGIVVSGLELSPRTAMTYAPYALSVASAQRIAQQGCSGQVGDVKYSILNPTQFAVQNGDCWVPMDGRAIPGTRLATIMGATNVPDMSGLFMRATEYNDGNDPDRGVMAATTIQGDGNKLHGHSFSGTTNNDGSHSHTYRDQYTREGTNGSGVEPAFTTTYDSNYDTANGDDDGKRGYANKTTTGSGNHSHSFSGTTGNSGAEARPKNMNFFIYIRVD
jgi:hypothetical protein